MSWQPIETAPRDGKTVLVSDGEYVVVARWNTEPNVWERDVDACWTVHEPEDYFYAWHLVDDPPTHWQPIPTPPEPDNA